MNRCSGVLMPMTSLPSKYGIGTMGKCAYDFVDFLKEAGQSYWQLLPLGPTGYGDSPYSSFSTFAGNPYLIDLDFLIKDGLLKRSEVNKINWGDEADKVDYGRIYDSRFKVLRLAYGRGWDKLSDEVSAFRKDNPWVENYALYMAVKASFDMKSWTQWPDDDIRLRKAEAVEKYSRLLRDDIDFYIFIQYLFFDQWDKLRAYAHENGIQFIGDVPIYVALDSADVWSEPYFFMLDEDNLPTVVAGCPPDAFTPDGQLWGNPIYDWEKMKNDGYGWWIRRIDGARRLYDMVRIDHFRGLESYWAVPYGEKTAAGGQWMPGPGMGLVRVLSTWFGDGIKYIAEDLGYMTPQVKKLVAESGFPNMAVLEFAFDAHDESDYLPHRCGRNTVCYIGTHDNDTVLGWLGETNKEDKKFAADYMHITDDEGWCWGMIRTGMSTSSDLFVAQMQDILELGGDCRMNTPGSAQGNWRWRMLPGALTKKLAHKLKAYTATYRRLLPVKEETESSDQPAAVSDQPAVVST